MISISGIYNNYLNAVNEDIVFEPIITVTAPDALSDMYIKWDDGVNPPYESFVISGIYTASFPYPDQYAIMISLVSSDDSMITSGFPPFQVSEFTDYDENLIRTYGTTNLALPYSKEDVRVPPNDWGVAEVINESFRKLEANKTYLENIGVIYYPPPFKYIGWLGSDKWHVQDIDTDSETFGTRFTSAIAVAVRDDNLICVSDGTGIGTARVVILSSDYNATFMAEITSKGVNDLFNEIRSVQVDDKNIYVLDAGVGYYNPRVIVYSYDITRVETTRTEYYFGGAGGESAHNKFRNPNSLKLDNNGYLYVADVGNNCLKKYSSTGSWIMTITSEYFAQKTEVYDQVFTIDQGAPIDLAVDSENNIHVLTCNYVVKFNSKGEFLKIYDWKIKGVSLSDKAIKIINSRDTGILYILLDKKIIRVSNAGVNLGIFGNSLFGTTLTNLNFTDITHDQHHNLLVTNNYNGVKCIIKYADSPRIGSVFSNIAFPFNISSVYINSEEYLSDYVYNKSFQRYYDILDDFRQKLVRTIRTDINGNITIRGMLSSDEIPFKYNKSDIFVGVNEIISDSVCNRVLDKLWDSENTLFSMISS